MTAEPTLPYLSAEDRLKTYQLVVDGCHHLWSKNKLQEGRLLPVVEQLVSLGQTDPYFLAHFTSWVMQKQSKDLKIMAIYANSLSSANGQPFSPKSKYSRPNLRYVSAAAVQQLDPKLVKRLMELERLKYGVDGLLNESRHFPNMLRTAIKKYLKYRENNLEIVRGIKKAGLANAYINLYRMIRMAPSDDVASILRWKQKGKDIDFEESPFNFEGLEPQEIAKKIRKDKLPVLGVIGSLPKMTPVVAVALLEQATGDQAVILRKTFEDAGVLKDDEVKELFNSKVAEAKNAIDRVKSFAHKASEEVRQGLKETKAKIRKQATQEIGKIFIHLDLSPSMEPALEVAKERGATIAEMVSNPADNFMWGTFNDRKEILPVPEEFVEDAFKAILFGKRCTGMTDAFQLYPEAREFEADVDVFISDGCHNIGDLDDRIRDYHTKHPSVKKPKAMVWVNVFNPHGAGYYVEAASNLKEGYEKNDIPVAELKADAITNSALVVQAVAEAMKGPMATIDSIMETPLLDLPDWYLAL